MEDDSLQLLATDEGEALATDDDSSLATAEADDVATDEQEEVTDDLGDEIDPRKEASYRGRYESERKQREALEARLAEQERQAQAVQQQQEQLQLQQARFELDRWEANQRQQDEQRLAQYRRAYQQDGYDDRQIEGWITQYRSQFEQQRQQQKQAVADRLERQMMTQRLQQMETLTIKQRFAAEMAPKMVQEAKDLFGVDIQVSQADVLKRIENAASPEAAEGILLRYAAQLAKEAKSGPARRNALKQSRDRFNVPTGASPSASFDVLEAKWASGSATARERDLYFKARERRQREGVPGF